MGSHEMHFPLGHFLPLGSLSAAPVLGVWEGLGGFGRAWSRLHTPEYAPLCLALWVGFHLCYCTHGSLHQWVPAVF